MNIVNKLTLRQLKGNKKRTLVTLIGVIISVAMITAVATLAFSFMNMLQRNAIASDGNWHVLYPGVNSAAQVEAIRKDNQTREVMLSRDVGYSELKGGTNPDKPYLFIKAYNTAGFTHYPIHLLEGRLPQNSDEIVLSKHIATNGGVTLAIGDKLMLAVGEREITGESSLEHDGRLLQSTRLLTENGVIEERLSKQRTPREFRVVGFIERPDWEPTSAPGYTVLTYTDEASLASDGPLDVSIQVKDIRRSMFKHAEQLVEANGLTKVSFNNGLLRYYGVIKEDSFNTTLYTLMGIVLVIIVLGSVSLIYNAFAISVSERARHLGMLGSIGATSKQKRRSVFFEGAVIGALSIPLGIVSGIAGMGITFAFINPLLGDVYNRFSNLQLVVSPQSLLLAAALSMATIFISIFIPARRAARISPIEAIRQTQDIRMNGKTVKTSRLTRLVFGFEAELGLKNLKRNKKRYRATVFSLIISLVLFLSMSAFTLYMEKTVSLTQDNLNFDIELTTFNTPLKKADQVFDQIKKLDKVDRYALSASFETTVTLPMEKAADFLQNMQGNPGEEGALGDEVNYQVTIRALSDEQFNEFIKEAGISTGSYFNPQTPEAIVIDRAKYQDRVTHQFVETKSVKLKVGEPLHLLYYDMTKEVMDDLVTLKVGALTGKLPLGMAEQQDTANFTVVVPRSSYDAIMAAHSAVVPLANLHLTSSDPLGLQEDIEEIKNANSLQDLNIYNLYQSRQRDKQMQQLVSIFVFGFVILISAVCVANIFNTISTSISLRKREFAMLRSVGMTPASFGKMIRYESIFYGLKALLYGLPLSFLAMYALYRSLSDSFSFAFTVPWVHIGVAVFAVFLIVGLAMVYSATKVRKGNIMDGLKQENI